MNARYFCALACIAGLAGCGGGSFSGEDERQLMADTLAALPSADPSSANAFPHLPPLPDLLPQHVSAATIRYGGFDGSRLHVGRNAVPDYPMQNAGKWGGPDELYYGTRHEHMDARQLAAYLDEISQVGKLHTFSQPPTVHIGRAMGFRQNVLRAVQWINSALPPAWHLRVGHDVPPLSDNVPRNAIYIDFGSPECSSASKCDGVDASSRRHRNVARWCRSLIS